LDRIIVSRNILILKEAPQLRWREKQFPKVAKLRIIRDVDGTRRLKNLSRGLKGTLSVRASVREVVPLEHQFFMIAALKVSRKHLEETSPVFRQHFLS